jgi:hypothetical protein
MSRMTGGLKKAGPVFVVQSVCFSSLSYGRGWAWQSSAAKPTLMELAEPRKQNLQRFSHLTEKSSHELFGFVTIVISLPLHATIAHLL